MKITLTMSKKECLDSMDQVLDFMSQIYTGDITLRNISESAAHYEGELTNVSNWLMQEWGEEYEDFESK